MSCVSMARAEEVLVALPRQLRLIRESVEFVVTEPIPCRFNAVLDHSLDGPRDASFLT